MYTGLTIPRQSEAGSDPDVNEINLPLILGAALITTASPGPATLAIAATSMGSGRRYGLALASGVTTGSLTWSIAAAFGMATIMLANAWVFETMRYFGAAYLLYLAIKSAHSAFRAEALSIQEITGVSMPGAYGKGLLLHLTNPKVILFFGALFSVGMPPGSSLQGFAMVIGAIGLQSFCVFHVYAFLFSSGPMITGYTRLRRWFEALFAIAFGAAGVKILTARIE